MDNNNNKFNTKIVKIITYIALLIPFLICLRVLIGYRKIIYVDLFLYLILIINLAATWHKKNKSERLFKIMMVSFLLLILSSLVLPGFEYLGPLKHYMLIFFIQFLQ